MASPADSLVCHAQKVINTDGSQIKSIELLSRVKKNDLGLTMDQFFAALSPEDSLEITLWQFDIAQRIYREKGVLCSVNVDNNVLSSEPLKATLLEHCRQLTTPLVLEFTEVHPMPSAEEANAFFAQLRECGVKVSLDDFGSGYNGMSIFADYDFDIVKIDRTLVMGVETRPQKAKILELVSRMIKTLDKDHVIEGVESAAQLEALTQIGFSNIQGFFLHKPQPLDEIQMP